MNIADRIYAVRGQKVMLDRDLAEIYGYTTRTLNQQVQRNKEKFEGEEFMFQLNEEDLEELLSLERLLPKTDNNLMSHFVTSSWGGTRKKPYAFTEQGIYMLMTVLKGELATRQSRLLVMTFKTMKDYIAENKALLDYRDRLNIIDKISENTEKIKKVDARVSKLANEMSKMVKRTEISPVFLDFAKATENKEFLLLDGEPTRAKEAYMEIYKLAKKRIYIVDNYINIKTLHLLQTVKQKMEIIFFTDNVRNYLRKTDLEDFESERPDLKIDFIKTNGKIHDRFIVLDDKKVYQAGSSSKDVGNKMTTIHEITEKFMTDALLDVISKMKSNPKVKLR